MNKKDDPFDIVRKTQTVEFTSEYGRIDAPINRWIEENPFKKILDIKYNTVTFGDGVIHESALVLYIEDNFKGERIY